MHRGLLLAVRPRWSASGMPWAPTVCGTWMTTDLTTHGSQRAVGSLLVDCAPDDLGGWPQRQRHCLCGQRIAGRFTSARSGCMVLLRDEGLGPCVHYLLRVTACYLAGLGWLPVTSRVRVGRWPHSRVRKRGCVQIPGFGISSAGGRSCRPRGALLGLAGSVVIRRTNQQADA